MHILDGTDCAQLPSVTNNYIVCAHIPILVQGIQEHMLASVQSLSLSLSVLTVFLNLAHSSGVSVSALAITGMMFTCKWDSK